MSRALTAVAALAALALPGLVRAQEDAGGTPCAAGRITNIFVDNRSIFDVEDLSPGSPLRWLYGLANSLHVTTRESFILREILFEVGECADPLLLAESGRILRTYPFIARADVFSVPQADGSVHVVVDTQDEWTTKVDVGVSVDDGVQLERVDLTEENLLGQGVLAAAFFRRRREQRDAGFRLEQPRLFGSRTDALIGLGKTRSGRFVEQELVYPFVGEIGRWAFRQTFRRRDRNLTYSAGEGGSVTHVLLPYEEEWVETSVAARIGRPGNLTLFGIGLSREKISFAGFPDDLEVAVGGNFDDTRPAPEEVRTLVAGQTAERATTRLNLMFGQRNLRFARVRGLDALDGDRDIRLGTDLGVTLGRSVDVFPGTRPGGGDLFARLRLFAGHDPGTSFVFANLAWEGRQLLSGDDRWRDVLAEADLYAYLRSRKLPGQTLFARVSASGGWSMTTPFQLTLGGREGVRGLLEESAPGARRLLLSIEDRIFLSWPAPDLLDFGFTVFADAGRMWAGAVPYGIDTDWVGTVGIGLRMGFPSRTRGVGRIDIAFPFGGARNDGPIFRVTLFELLGLSGGFADGQLERSRRVRVGPDFFVTER